MTTVPESIARSDWIPVLSKDDANNSWKAFFRSFMLCPKCGHNASTNGKGSWRCPRCGWKKEPARGARKIKSEVA